jgi:hypothetical protein
MSLGIFALLLMFATKDGVYLLQAINICQACGVLLYLLIAPESPSWCILNNQFNRGIDCLNYISWLNGSKNRIPYTAEFDVLGDVYQ